MIRYLAFLLALPLWAANTLVITDTSGSTQTNRPITHHRIFVKGEIANFPQPTIGGTPLTVWQSDVKARWNDGSVQGADISFLNTISGNGSITEGYVNNASPNSGGSALTEAQMLTFNSSNWDATMAITGSCVGFGASGGTCTVDPRTIISDDVSAGKTCGGSGSRCTYWLSGPVVTQVILRGPSDDVAHLFDYDFGTDSNHSLHPTFILTFYAGATTVKVDYILENMWTTKLQDQLYTLNLRAGNPSLSVVYTKSNYTHIAQARWRKTFWTGSTPGSINIDHNLAYLVSTGAFQNWDLSLVVPAASITQDNNDYNASDKGDLGGHCLWDQTMGGTGGRPDIGMQPAWYVRGLFTFATTEATLMAGCSEVAGYVPIHLRESATGKFYNSAHTVDALGLPLSIEARPTFNVVGVSSGDAITPIGPVSTAGWIYDMAHVPAMTYTPYILFGDYYFLEELQFYASYALAVGDPGFIFYGRGGSYGIIPYSLQTRGEAWGLRDLFEATFISPDASNTKAYLNQKVNNNIQAREGFQNITNGSFPPVNAACPGYSPSPGANIWCFGRLTIGEGVGNPLFFVDHGDPYGGGCWGAGTGANPLIQSGPFTCVYGDAPWMINFFLGSFAHSQELGFPSGPLNSVQFKNLLHQLQDPGYNPWLAGVYKMPITRTSTGTYFQTWADVLQGFNPNANCVSGPGTINWQTVSFWSTCDGGSSDNDFVNPGYPHIMKGTASYLVGFNINDAGLTGVNAWNWTLAHVGEGGGGVNPQFELLPRTGTTSTSPTVTTSCPLPTATQNTVYPSVQLTATGTPPITWDLSVGSLPTGLSLSSTGLITGTPTGTGNSSFTLRATGIAPPGTKACSLLVNTAPIAPVITTTTLPNGTANTAYSQTINTTGDLPQTFAVVSGSLPPGFMITGTGPATLSGTTPGPGQFTFGLAATNIAGTSPTVVYTINFSPVVNPLNYSITTAGPHHVVQGHYLFFNIVGTVISGTDESATPTTTGLPANTTVTYVNQVKFCCGPRTAGITGNNPIQVTTANNTSIGTYPLTITYVSASGVTRSTVYSLSVDPVPGPLTTTTPPMDTALTGLATYNSNMTSFGATYCTPPLGGPAFEGFVWYYDGTRVMRQVSDYTSNPGTWLPCSLELDTLYQAYVLNNSGNIPGFHVFPRGLQLSYNLSGVTNDKNALIAMQTNGYANFGNISPQNTTSLIDWSLSREISYGLETNLETEAVGVPRIANFQNVVEVLIGHFDQWFISKTAPYAQPFMVALACEALIQYWDVTGDVRVPPLIKLAADQLYSVSWDTIGPTNSFLYYNYNAAAGPPPPLPYPYDPMCSNKASFTVTCEGPSPDLNLLIVPIYGWVFQHTGDISYRTKGDIAFNAGVSGAFLGAGKQFSQNYRWSMKYITWRTSGIPVITSSSPLPDATISVAYNTFQFTANGAATITWGATGLPTGMSLSSSGALTGTPTVSGPFTVLVTATNSVGNSGPIPFTLNVVPAATAPVITTTRPQVPGGSKSVPYSFQFIATGTAPLTWSISNNPGWMSINSSTGVISGTPDVGGTSQINVTAMNGTGMDSKDFTVVIAGGAPTITSSAVLPPATFGVPYIYVFTISGDPPITCSSTGTAAWMTFNVNTCSISGTPNANGLTSMTVTATNAAGIDGPHNYSLTTFQILPGNIRLSSPVIFSGGSIH